MVSNLDKAEKKVGVVFNLADLGMGDRATAIDTLTGDPVEIDKGKIELNLKSLGWNLIHISTLHQ